MRTLKSFLFRLLLLGAFLLTSTNVPAFAFVNDLDLLPTTAENSGPETGGGGNIIFAEGQLSLLDFFNLQNVTQFKNFVEAKHAQHVAALNTLSIANLTTAPSPALQQTAGTLIGYSEILMKQWGLTSERNSNTLADQRHQPAPAPLRINWVFVDKIKSDAAYYRPRFLPQSYQIEKAAFYSIRGREVQISRYIWAQLGFPDRLGLIVHEKLRQIQLTFGFIVDESALLRVRWINNNFFHLGVGFFFSNTYSGSACNLRSEERRVGKEC